MFDPVVIVSLGLPLFIVTMAGQNVPGFVVMSTFGYRPAPRVVLVGSGLATMVGATFGAHSINLAAITAALMASPDAHPDKSKRWIATATSGVTYLVLGLGAGFAAALVAASPPILITAVAGLALLGALVTSVTGALEDERAAGFGSALRCGQNTFVSKMKVLCPQLNEQVGTGRGRAS